MPSAFSPNNDGRNDVLLAIPVGIIKFNFLKVYNRWGQEIFNTPDFKKGWNGRFLNIDQPAGIYLWITSGIDFNGKIISRKGTVMLIK